ncbi:hypothetical protein ACFS7Z_25475 [Pontibacter toksunensis]|uniref:Archaemetzincin n=1 Tax=Pontibacter toksunensis TaxID=1332631 RepID=A0ABW6C3H7_9BACT
MFFKGKIALAPLAGVDESSWEVRFIKSQIEDIYGFEVDVLDRQKMPKSAYDSPPGYNASLLLDYLTAAMPNKYDKIMGVTDSSIYATKEDSSNWAVNGLSYNGGVACVISTHAFGIKKLNGGRYERRLAKASLHELGHTLGLPHCDNTPSCFMTEAREQVKTIDSEEIILCRSCKRLIAFAQN